MSAQVEFLAAYIQNALVGEGFTVHRYDATTGSVYLKLDYGACGTIRVADHKSGRWPYMWEIGPHIIVRENRTHDTRVRHLYRPEDRDEMVGDILALREERCAEDGVYESNVHLYRCRFEDRTTRFSKHCRKVS